MIIEERGKTKDGYEYIIGIHNTLGHRMGYVGVFPNSPLYSKCYTQEEDGEEYTGIEYNVHVHGGLIFSGQLDENIIGGDNPHYFGFDCAHLDDGKIKPDEMAKQYHKFYTNKSSQEINIMSIRYKQLYDTLNFFDTGYVRTVEYVRNECFDLSSQLKKLEDDYGDV